MPEPSSAAIEIWKQRFRRKYAADLSGLRTLSDTIASEASEVVTITQTNVDGGSAAGVITGNKLEMLAAAEAIIQELDPSPAAAPFHGTVVRFQP